MRRWGLDSRGGEGTGWQPQRWSSPNGLDATQRKEALRSQVVVVEVEEKLIQLDVEETFVPTPCR